MLVSVDWTTAKARDKRSARILATSVCVSQLFLGDPLDKKTTPQAWKGSAADEGGFGAPCVSASRASPSIILGVGAGSAMKSTVAIQQHEQSGGIVLQRVLALVGELIPLTTFVVSPTRLKHSNSGGVPASLEIWPRQRSAMMYGYTIT